MDQSPRIAILVARLVGGAAPCLASLAGQRVFADEDLFLASGTAWAETVNRAWQTAIDTGRDYAAFLWLDERMELDPGALDRLFADAAMVADPHEPLVMAGAVLAPSRELTVGGAFAQRDPAHPLALDPMRADRTPQMAATVSGEAVLVTHAAHAALGALDASLEGAAAAVDYGLRAQAAGIPVMLAGEPVGVTASDDRAMDWSGDPALAARYSAGILARLRGAIGM